MTFEAAAALCYLAAVVLAVAVWSFYGFDSKHADAIGNLAHTLPGMIAFLAFQHGGDIGLDI